MADALTHADVYNQIFDSRSAEPRTPVAVRLGATQRAAIEAHIRELGGPNVQTSPILSFAGLDVRESKKDDAIELVFSDTPPEAELAVPPIPDDAILPTPPSEPPAEVAPSAG